MLKSLAPVTFALLGPALFAASAGYTALPLRPRTAPEGAKAFTCLTPEETNVTVPNVFDDPRMWGDRFRELTLGAVETGIVAADFDLDGQPDIFAVSKNGPCALYRQVAPFKFLDVAVPAGVACAEPGNKTGATAADINGDGLPDLYVCRYDAPNLLFINNGDGTFTESAHAWGLDIRDASVHAVFADYDRDGFLDCYLVTNILDFSKSPQGRRDYLFRNDGHGRFVDVTAAAGIWGLTQGHTAMWFDANQDGWPDLYVANDFETPDRFYLNKGDGTFVDVVDARLPHVTYFSMGADASDVNNDGLVDFLITDMRDRNHAEFMTGMEEIGRGLWEMERVSELIPQYMWNALYLNTGTDRYSEIAHLTGMEATGWTFSTRLGDLDNDGRVDAFFTTGMIRNFIDADLVDRQNVAPTLAARAAVWKNAPPRVETPLAYRNLGQLAFADVSAEWGFTQPRASFGCALVDLDNDGDLDLVFSNYNEPPTIVRNNTTDGHRVMIRLAGRGANPEGIGAEIAIESASGRQIRQLYPQRGITSSEPSLIHFGLGSDERIDRLTVRWPSGQTQVLEQLPADRLLTIREPDPAADAPKPPPAQLAAPARADALFTEAAAKHGLNRTATLRRFDEFGRQRLLPRRFNGLAPALASADVNGDGRADLFVSGSSGQPGQLWLAQTDGAFAPAPSQPWASAAECDDTGALFFDANGDGHPDLFISAGGVEAERGDARLQNRLYLNDGRGAFTLAAAGVLPDDAESSCASAAADFDGDGKIDLFVGGRLVPGRYPETPRSFLYRNEGGRFIDATEQLAPGLRDVGMVTGATWSDLDGDGRPDLVLALDWGAITVFRNTGSGFENITARLGLAAHTGWWRTVAALDVDGDGRNDLVAGNVGLNTKYRASPSEPAVLFAGDLDGSGKSQIVEAHHENGKLYPVRGRSKLAYSFPWLTKKFRTFKAFAQATIEDIFDAERLAGAQKLVATELASGIFFQQPDGTFAFRPFDRAAQIAPINAIVARDFDRDGHLDLFCAENDFSAEPNTGRFDGGLGLLLKGDGRGGFRAVSPAESGIVVTGEARAAVALPLAGSKADALVVARCEGPLLLFTSQPR